MCGLTGIWRRGRACEAHALAAQVRAMADTLEHRGPDDAGVWTDAARGIGLGHRRLSILDLSPAGHQPMVSSDGAFVIAYNGEVYNFRELRAELEQRGHAFNGGSDTEVILAAIVEWGLEAAVRRLIGMFAFALWDAREHALHLVRDRLGIKPLYWTCSDGLALFGSELKALRSCDDWQPRVDRDALAAYMRHGYVPAPWTIYERVRKIEPGCIVTLCERGEPREHRYWSAFDVAMAGAQRRDAASEAERLDELDTLLRDAVRRRMIADVPVGAFLSGGIDSSTVVALMQAESSTKVRTFSIGFDVAGYDEARHAKAVAAHLGTEHTELYVEPQHARDVIPDIPEMFDEPFADSSQVPTYLVSELTRRHVTVALSGDGGDELFAGYNRYRHALNLCRQAAAIPAPLRRCASAALRAVPPAVFDAVSNLLPSRLSVPQAGHKAHKLAAILDADERSIYLGLVSLWPQPSQVVPGSREHRGALWDESLPSRFADRVEYMQYLDTVTYLPDDILTKVDRASMRVSLEARVPLLDHRVVEFASALPQRMKLRGGTTKWALRQVLDRYVPRALVERPKMGFGVPIDHWLRGPLSEWADDLLAPQALEADGFLDAAPVREKWAQHRAGTHNWQYLLWNVLVFQSWRSRWL